MARFNARKMQVHINVNTLIANKKYTKNDPAVKVDRGTIDTTMTYGATILDGSVCIFAPEDPNACGARVWMLAFGEENVLPHTAVEPNVYATRFVPRRLANCDFVIDIYRYTGDTAQPYDATQWTCVQSVQQGIFFTGPAHVFHRQDQRPQCWIETFYATHLLPPNASVDDIENVCYTAYMKRSEGIRSGKEEEGAA